MGLAQIPGPSYRTPGGVNAITSQAAVSAVATVTNAVSYIIPANTLAAGSSYRIAASGTVDNSAASPTFNWVLRLGGVTLATVSVPSVTTAGTGKAWKAEALLTCRLAGASGKVVGSIQVTNEIATTFTAAVNIDSPIVNAGTFNTTLAQQIDMAMFMGTAVAANVMRAEVALVELVRL